MTGVVDADVDVVQVAAVCSLVPGGVELRVAWQTRDSRGYCPAMQEG